MENKIPEKIYSLEITTNIGCKINCNYCPQSLLYKTYTENGTNKKNLMMSFELFKKCVSKVVTGGTISFCGMSEPFLNPECTKMIQYAYSQGFRITLFTTLVGMSMEDLELIKDIDFQNVVLHIPDKEGNAHFCITPEYLEVLEEFTKTIKINSYSCHGEVHEKVKKYISSDIYLRDKLHGRAGNINAEDVEVYQHTGNIICTCGIDSHGGAVPILLPDGRLVICGNDYGMKHVLGNLYTEEWKEIASGEQMKQILYGFRDDTYDTLCRHCHNARRVQDKEDNEFVVGPMNALVISNFIKDVIEKRITPTQRQNQIIEKLKNADNICIFGCGKLFNDNYYMSTWNEVINANIITDNNANNLQRADIKELKKISPNELKYKSNMLVITYVKDDSSIVKQLKDMNIENVLNIYDLYNMLE